MRMMRSIAVGPMLRRRSGSGHERSDSSQSGAVGIQSGAVGIQSGAVGMSIDDSFHDGIQVAGGAVQVDTDGGAAQWVETV